MTKAEILEQLETIMEELETLINDADGHEELGDDFVEGLDTALGELKFVYEQKNS